jgi:RNA polymerase sigma factor (sigma-70 family)
VICAWSTWSGQISSVPRSRASALGAEACQRAGMRSAVTRGAVCRARKFLVFMFFSVLPLICFREKPNLLHAFLLVLIGREVRIPCAMQAQLIRPSGPSAAPAGLPGPRDHFVTTHWSLVLSASFQHSPSSEAALEQLCRTYWYPLYAYVRRRGYPPEEAQDLTQEFFARLVEKNFLRLADRERGRFRTFLLTALQNFLIKEWQKAHAAKRGGRQTMLSWDAREAENRYLAEPADAASPDVLYARRWAFALLDRVFEQLRQEWSGAGKSAIFERLKDFLWGEQPAGSYAQLAAHLGTTEGAARVALHRLRRRYRDLLRAEIAHTVSDPAEVDDELRELMRVLRG